MSIYFYKFKKTNQLAAVLQLQEMTNWQSWYCHFVLKDTLNCDKFFCIVKTEDNILIFNDEIFDLKFDYDNYKKKTSQQLEKFMEDALNKVNFPNKPMYLGFTTMDRK